MTEVVPQRWFRAYIRVGCRRLKSFTLSLPKGKNTKSFTIFTRSRKLRKQKRSIVYATVFVFNILPSLVRYQDQDGCIEAVWNWVPAQIRRQRPGSWKSPAAAAAAESTPVCHHSAGQNDQKGPFTITPKAPVPQVKDRRQGVVRHCKIHP